MNDFKWPGIVICCMFICAALTVTLVRIFGPEDPSVALEITEIASTNYNHHAYINLGNGWLHDPDCETCIRRDVSITSAHATNKTTIVTSHGIPAPPDPNHPWLGMEYPVLVVETNDVYY